MSDWYVVRNGNGGTGADRALHDTPECSSIHSANKIVEATPEDVERYDPCKTCSDESDPIDQDWSQYRALVEAAKGNGGETA